MFDLKKITALSWNKESSINVLPFDSQIYIFKGFVLNRGIDEAMFRLIFDEINLETGSCHGNIMIGGTTVRLDGKFYLDKNNQYVVTSVDTNNIDTNGMSNQYKEVLEGSAATVIPKTCNDDNTVIANSDDCYETTGKFEKAEDKPASTMPDSQNSDDKKDDNPLNDVIVYKDTHTHDINLMLMNNYDNIKNVNEKHFIVHTKEQFYNEEKVDFPYIYTENDKYKVLISEDKTIGCESSLGAKLLVALHNDKDACRIIGTYLDTIYVNNIYEDLKNEAEKKDVNIYKPLKALKHIGFNFMNEAGTMRTAM